LANEMISDSSLILGLNRSSDASFCLLRDGEILAFGRKERLNRIKHAWGTLGDIALYRSSHRNFGDTIAVVVECFSSDSQRFRMDEYKSELECKLSLSKDVVHREISHHFAHAYSAFYPSGFEAAAVVIVDNRGSPIELVGETAEVRHPPRSIEFEDGALEVLSVFDADVTGIRPMSRQWWDRSSGSPVGLGMFYSMATRAVFGRANREGVLMGLAAHGSATHMPMPPLEVRGCEVLIPPEWQTMLADVDRFASFRSDSESLSDAADFAARVQLTFEEALIAITRNARALTGKENLVYAGGCALNCSANARLVAESGFRRVFVPPACDDGGTSIGCAIYGAQLIGGDPFAWTWDKDYLGPPKTGEAYLLDSMAASMNLVVDQPDGLIAEVALAIKNGEIIAIYQGRSESGPRALGNRSILADPRHISTRDFINSEVKHREWFRPLAPVVRAENVSKYFDTDGASPFMQRKVMVRPEWRQALGAVCHVDGSARVQTVSQLQNPFLYDLLGEFSRLTGIDILLNTSFNGADEPIVENLQDACAALRRLKIDRLITPPFSVKRA
jgi:carbamoyltransferase